MPDFRAILKDLFLKANSGLIRRALSRWIPGCPLTLDEWAQSHISYSQLGEDLFIDWVLREKTRNNTPLFYVDIGCWKPVKHSNSFLFYRQGGHGIAVDPNASLVDIFRKQRPRDTVIHAAITSEEGSAEYCCYGWDEANSLVASTQHDNTSVLGQSPQRIISVPAMTLSGLLERHLPAKTTVDFLDIDCEGHDLAILQSNDWNRFRPTVILVEAHGLERQMETQEYLKAIDYETIATIGWSMVFQHLPSPAKTLDGL